MKKRLLSLLMVLVMVLGMFPVSAMASGEPGSVRVIVENTTFPVSEGAAWDGTLLDTTVVLTEDMTMMTAVLTALEAAGHTWNSYSENYGITYIGSIDKDGTKKLEEFDGGTDSGWMGTLNDWFVGLGFDQWSVADGELVDGDEIRIMYTRNRGADLDAQFGANAGYLSSLAVSSGTLTPAFDKDTLAYTLTLDSGVETVDVTAVAENKNDQVKVSADEEYYHRGEGVLVEDGTEISVICGDNTYLITVKQEAAPVVHSVTLPEGDGYTVTGASTITNGENYNFTVAITDGYDGSSMVVAVNGETITDTDGTYCVEAVTEDLVITVIGVKKATYGAMLPINYSSSNGSLNSVQFTQTNGEAIEGLISSIDGTTIHVELPGSYDLSGKVRATFDLTQNSSGLPFITTKTGTSGTSSGKAVNNKFTYKDITLSKGAAAFTFYYYNISPKTTKNEYTTFSLNLAVKNTLPTLAAGQSASVEDAIVAGETYELDLSKVFADADGDALTYKVSINGATAVAANAAFTYSTNIAGTYTLVFTANDGKGDSTETYTATLTVTNTTETKNMYVQVPEGMEPAFYVTNGFADGTDVLGDSLTAVAGATNGGLKTYAVTYPANATHISIRDNDWGGMAVAVKEDDTTTMRKLTANVVDFTDTETAATVTVTYGDNTAAAGSAGWLLEVGQTYSVKAAPVDTATYAAKTETVSLETGAAAEEITLKLAYSSPKTIIAPTGATVRLFDYSKYYAFNEVDCKVVVDNGDGTSTWYFVTGQTDLSWRADMEGKVTESGYLPWKGTVTVTFDDGAASSTKNADIEDNSVLVNVNGQNHLNMSVGGTYKLKGYRAWEIIKYSYQNEIITPNFNWNILSGSDVISLTPEKSKSNSGSGEQSDWMTVKALKDGTAVIEVSYDAIDTSSDEGHFPGLYKATDPARTGLIVVTVGGADSTVKFGIDCYASQGSVLYSKSTPKAWDAEFDTLYFTGSSGKLKFAPTASGEITEVAVSNDKGASWTTLTAESGVYTANIVSGNNILRVTTDSGVAYQVVRGDQVTVTLTEQNGDDDGFYEAGETVRVTLDGLHTPIPKMAGNYNPGYAGNTDGKSTVHMTYTINGQSVEGAGSQYDFATASNYIDVVIPEDYAENTLTMTEGYIGVGVIGLTAFADGGDSHRNIPDDGCSTRGDKTTFHTRSILPEIEILIDGTPASVEVESVTLSETELALVEEETAVLTAAVLPDNATDKTVTWSSSNEIVAEVNNGTVTAVGAGVATITATAGDKSATCTVTVTTKTIEVDGVFLNKTTLELVEEETETLTATVLPENATDKTVTWSSSNEAVATVNNGTVTAVGAGTATITASAGDKSATCTVTVTAKTIEVDSVSLNKTTLELVEEETETLTATVLPENATDKTVTWSSSNETVAEVNNGTVTAVGAGIATITATAGDKSATCTVTVTAKTIEVDGVSLNKTTLELVEEETETLTATVLPENATDKTVTWSSSNEAVATVNNGTVIAVGAGTATITATAGGKTATCVVTVTAKILPVTLDQMYQATAETLKKYSVGTGSIGGEWLVFGLGRTLDQAPTEQQLAAYLAAVKSYIGNNISNGKLHNYKSTENSRIALALTALGYDPADFEGYNLLAAFADTEWAIWQGNNAAAFALLALNAADYDANNTEALIETLLDSQNADGGWAITTGESDLDATAMAVQALAPYYAKSDVKNAIDAALELLASKLNSKGQIDLGNVSAPPSPELNAQVIVALAELGRDPATDAQFTNNGKTLIDGLATFFVENGFAHKEGDSYNQMATEQAFYAMVACKRVAAGEDSLYDMSVNREVKYTITVATAANGTVTASADQAAAGTEITLTVEPAIGYELKTLTVKDAANNTIHVTNNKFLMPASNVTVTAVFEETENPAQDVIDAIDALVVTKADKATQQKISDVLAAYEELSAENKGKVTNYSKLEAAIAAFNRLLNTAKSEATEDLEAIFAALKEKDYTKENWQKVQALRNKALTNVEKAENIDEISTIVKQAKADLEKIATGGEITVTFRLIGDGQHDNGVTGHEEYVTWIPTTTYKLKPGATMYDVFMEAMADYGLSQRGAANGYVESIKAPACLGGYWLGEFDNGPNSGWMYTVNGDHPGTGLKTFNLTDGDRIIWHYVDDYIQEERTSSSKYYYRWLEAKDITPEEWLKTQKEEDPAVTDGFEDVNERDWFYDDVMYVVKEGLFNGTGDNKFSPNASMNRAMLVTVLYRLEGEPKVTGSSAFDDVTGGQWYTDAVIWATKKEIVNGYGNGKFGPTDNITREQMATILFRYAQFKRYDTSASNSLTGYGDFNDISVFSLKALKWANAEGLINGRTATTLSPKGTVTRAEVAAILHRFVENVVNK